MSLDRLNEFLALTVDVNVWYFQFQLQLRLYVPYMRVFKVWKFILHCLHEPSSLLSHWWLLLSSPSSWSSSPWPVAAFCISCSASVLTMVGQLYTLKVEATVAQYIYLNIRRDVCLYVNRESIYTLCSRILKEDMRNVCTCMKVWYLTRHDFSFPIGIFNVCKVFNACLTLTRPTEGILKSAHP